MNCREVRISNWIHLDMLGRWIEMRVMWIHWYREWRSMRSSRRDWRNVFSRRIRCWMNSLVRLVKLMIVGWEWRRKGRRLESIWINRSIDCRRVSRPYCLMISRYLYTNKLFMISRININRLLLIMVLLFYLFIYSYRELEYVGT
jgi:hypothetical protein